jgi:hypothetical protein
VEKNQLYYGDNLEVLRQHLKDESVDLIYLDPPFNSRQDYNVLFAEKDGTRSSSQIMACEDTWEWNVDAERAYEEIVEQGGRVSDAMRAFRTFLGHDEPPEREWLQGCRQDLCCDPGPAGTRRVPRAPLFAFFGMDTSGTRL